MVTYYVDQIPLYKEPLDGVILGSLAINLISIIPIKAFFGLLIIKTKHYIFSLEKKEVVYLGDWTTCKQSDTIFIHYI